MKIYVLANTLLFKSVISGGDIVLPQISKHWKGKYDIHVITGGLGKKTWQGLGAKAEFYLLRENFLEKSESLILAPLKYIIRTVQAIFIINRLLRKEEKEALLYTSSDLFPDTVPTFWAKKKFQNAFWLARIYHINEPPYKRRGNPFYNLFSYLAQRFGLLLIKKKADLIAPLMGTYQDLLDLGFPKEKIKVSNAGVNTETIRKVKSVKKEFDAVHVGALTFTKGVYDLLEIWRLIVEIKRDAQLAIIGGGSKALIEGYKKRIKDMGLSENIDYYGFVPKNEDVYAIIKASKIYLCPGHENGWSLPVAEAMTFGIPVVAYNLKMFGNAFKKGFIVVPVHDQKKFAEKVIELLEDEKKRKELAKEALIESKNFDWHNIAQDLSKYIDELVKK